MPPQASESLRKPSEEPNFAKLCHPELLQGPPSSFFDKFLSLRTLEFAIHYTVFDGFGIFKKIVSLALSRPLKDFKMNAKMAEKLLCRVPRAPKMVKKTFQNVSQGF